MKQYTRNYDDRIFDIIVGSNAKENWTIIDDSDSFDLWLHIDDLPSCHVIIREKLQKNNSLDTNNASNFGFPLNIINEAAILCKTHTKIKTTTKVKIIYTTIQNIKKGKIVGEVNVSNEKYINL